MEEKPTALQVWSKVWSKQKNSLETCVPRLFFVVEAMGVELFSERKETKN